MQPNYVKALELASVQKEFDEGETVLSWRQQQIKNITDPTLNVSVANVLPDSEMQYTLNGVNVK